MGSLCSLELSHFVDRDPKGLDAGGPCAGC